MYGKTFSARIMSFILATLLVGCGGGGGGGGSAQTTDPSINLSQIKSFMEGTAPPGSVLTFNMRPIDRHSQDSVKVSYTVDPQTVYMSEIVRPSREIREMTYDIYGINSITFTWTTTRYSLPSGNLYKVEYSNGGIPDIGTPVAQNILPSTARVGDYGHYMVLEVPDSNYQGTIDWRIAPGYNGNNILILAYTLPFFAGFIDTYSYSIKPDGSIASMTYSSLNTVTGIASNFSSN